MQNRMVHCINNSISSPRRILFPFSKLCGEGEQEGRNRKTHIARLPSTFKSIDSITFTTKIYTLVLTYRHRLLFSPLTFFLLFSLTKNIKCGRGKNLLKPRIRARQRRLKIIFSGTTFTRCMTYCSRRKKKSVFT